MNGQESQQQQLVEDKPSVSTRGGKKQGSKPKSSKREASSFTERRSQLRQQIQVQSPGPSVVTNLQKLSAVMDDIVTVLPSQVPDLVPISSAGYVDVCSTVYNDVVSRNPNLASTMSEPEFLMCSSWLLVDRSLSIMYDVFHRSVLGYHDLHTSIKTLRDVPTPIAHYLDCFGVTQQPGGKQVAPQVVLPQLNVDATVRGMNPGSPSSGYTAYDDKAIFAMLPFGSWKRSIKNMRVRNGDFSFDHTNVASENPLRVHSLGRDGHNILDNDVAYANPGCFPKITGFRAPSAQRLHGITDPFTRVYQNDDVRSVIFFSSELFQLYTLFLDRCRASITFSKIPETLKGDLSILVRCAPVGGTQNTRPIGFSLDSPYQIDIDSAHASRLFRFREVPGYPGHAIQVSSDLAGDMVDFSGTESIETTSGHLNEYVFEVTPVVDSVLLLNAFVRKFHK